MHPNRTKANKPTSVEVQGGKGSPFRPMEEFRSCMTRKKAFDGVGKNEMRAYHSDPGWSLLLLVL